MKFNEKALHDKILGCLVTAGMGDAIGAPSEALSQSEIKQKFSGYITKFEEAGDNAYAKGNVLAEVTDDASQMYEMAKAIVAAKGNPTIQDAADAIIAWSQKYPKYYPRNAGPTTSHVIGELTAGKDPIQVGKAGGVYGRGVSNGAAMRVAAAGLVYPGDLEKTTQLAVTISKPSHGTQHAYAGAAAVACGISQALVPGVDLFSVIKACYHGAVEGERIGKKEARLAPGFSLLPRLLKAVECAVSSPDTPSLLVTVEREVGNDGGIQTSVAAAIGLFLGTGGEPIPTILAGANLGGDTDTIACIAGMLAGAYKGFAAVPSEMYHTFKAANPLLDFETVAAQLTEIAWANVSA